ncbi:MAG: hypothetical protein ACREVL_11765 [Solimonas sp.]
MTRARTLLLAIVASFVIFGLLDACFPHPPSLPGDFVVLHGITLGILLFAWCKADAKERDVHAPAMAALLVGLIAPIGVPYYFYSTRPRGAATLATVKALGFLLGTTVLGDVAAMMGEQIF